MNNKEKNMERPPVVVVMGHVDHGKSSILEAIKDLKITGKEAGGITQHIGAYEVEHQGKKITFLDTPGHEAFSLMRSRGAGVADIAILVVAADDGVKAQTKEAISHINKEEMPMIVAINKIDKPEADPNKVIQQLSFEGIYLESIGGKVPEVLLSAKKKENINGLLEMILLVAEIEGFKADESAPSTGTIVESHLDSLKGPVATVIIKTGILRKGDIIATSSVMGKIKSIEDFQNNPINEATLSMPAILYGFEGVPLVGDDFKVFSDNNIAKEFIRNNNSKKDIPVKKEVCSVQSLNVILKADFLGSLEAIEGMIAGIPQERMGLNILKSGVGDINESDIKLAKSTEAIVFGFRVKVAPQVDSIIEREKVTVLMFDIIYKLIEKVREVMELAITPRIERVNLGKAKVLELFFDGKNHQIIGCSVIEGEVRKGATVEVVRINANKEEEEIGRGKIKVLKRGNREVESVDKQEECGISYEGGPKIEKGDILQVYIMEKEKIDGI